MPDGACNHAINSMDLSPFYLQDPTQLPPELAGKQWPPG
jgi:hypothetical protein